MKWIRTNNALSAEGFELWSDTNKLAGINFSSHTHIARVMSDIGKRLFFFEKKGLFNQRAVITNEYGITMGMVEEERGGKGILQLDGKKYRFAFDRNNTGELTVFDENLHQPLISCHFNEALPLTPGRSLLNTKFPCLLLALCWYAFQPHVALTERALASH